MILQIHPGSLASKNDLLCVGDVIDKVNTITLYTTTNVMTTD